MDLVPTSPKDGTHIFDDFIDNSGVADTTVGKIGWEMTTIANASTPSFVASQNGILRVTTANSADGDGEVFTTHPDGIMLAGTNQWFRFRVSFPDIAGNLLAGNNFHIGFGDGVTAADHAVGVWVHSDSGVVSLEGASTNGDISEDAGFTMVKGTTYNMAVEMYDTNANGGPKTLKLFIDGVLYATIENFLMGATETMEFGFKHWQDTTGAATLEMDLDYIEAWLPRN